MHACTSARHLALMALLASAICLAIGLMREAGTSAANAAPLPEATVAAYGETADGSMQIVVFEVADCIYCNLFRRHVEPVYAASTRAKTVPMRFVDLNDENAGTVGLQRPVDQVPTAVLLHENREIGRIPGYVGPETFFHAISHLIGAAD